MSGRLCFICKEPNYDGNETIISVRRRTMDPETGATSTLTWDGMVCDDCIQKYLWALGKEVTND